MVVVHIITGTAMMTPTRIITRRKTGARRIL
jgi:hypothetical protein